jgi:ABC-type transport system substrate-binding protein
MNAHDMPVLVPVGTIREKLDNDAPDYIFAPDLYLTLALAYDSLAAPAAEIGADGVSRPLFDTMEPRLAVGWEERPDGGWIVRLRPGVRSHAGNELTAEDIAWTFEKSFAQDVMAAWRWRGVIGVERVDVLDRYTVGFALRAPYPTFPNWLISVSPNLVDSTAIRTHATAGDPWGIAWLNGHVAGFGAYALEDMNSQRLAFSGRADYWMGAPEAARIEVCKVADRKSAIELLRDRRPVIVIGTVPDETAALLARDDLTVLRTWASHVSIEIDFTLPPFDDQRVRHALALATPYEPIISQGLLGLARPWRSPVKGVSQWYSDACWNYGSDFRRARQLMAEAGYGDGLHSDFYFDRRPDCERIAALIAQAWREIGVELAFKDLAEAPAGWLPPLHLRTECSHNLSEPIYDLAHDYAAMNPLLPLPGGPVHVGNWTPRWKKNPAALARYVDLLMERDPARKRSRFDALQAWLTDFGSSIFIAELQQAMVANQPVPRSLIAPRSRFFQALQYQNCTSRYLPRYQAL